MIYQLISNYVSMGTAREALARARARTRMHAHARACTHEYNMDVRMYICMIRQLISNCVNMGAAREALAHALARASTHMHAHAPTRACKNQIAPMSHNGHRDIVCLRGSRMCLIYLILVLKDMLCARRMKS